MRVWQPGSSLVQAQAKVEDWSWAATKRRLRALYLLARPYRARTGLVILSLLGATGVSLVPPFLIGRAVDEVHHHRTHALGWIVVAFDAQRARGMGPSCADT